MMEYVPWFFGEIAEGEKPSASALVVTPNQYDIMLVNDGKPSSDGEDYPKKYAKGPEPKGDWDYIKGGERKPEEYYKKDYYKRDGGERDYYPPHSKGGDRERNYGGGRDEERRRGPAHRQ
jgi:hypothetical protein